MSHFQVGAPWQHENLKFYGLSLSGIRTSLSLPELQIAFDVAQGYPFLFPLKKFFISHGHLDHAAGIPYIISQKALYHIPPGEFYMPPSLVEPMHEIMKIWERIEDHQYQCQFIPMKDQEVPLKGTYFVKSFATHHRIDSLGYTLFNRNKKLAAAWTKASREEIVRAKKQGELIEEILDVPLVSFTGDTKIEFLFEKDWIRKSKILFLESTYLDEDKSIAKARQWGHTHLDEIIPYLDSIESEKIVLIHISSRYSFEQALNIVKRKVPKQYHERVEIFPGR